MSFERSFKLASFLLITAGFLALVSTGGIAPVPAILMAAVIVASWFVDTERVRRLIPRRVLNTVAVACLPLYLADYRWVSRSFLVATVHLVFVFAAIKLLTRSTDRDYVYLYLISFAQLLTASTMTIDMLFGAALALFLVSAVGTLILFEMRRSNARAVREVPIQPLVGLPGYRASDVALFARFPAASVLWISLSATAAILLLAVPFFVIVPRVALGIYRRPAGRTQMVSGFSDTVQLGQLGSIAESDAVVMRVRLNLPPNEIPAGLKWRGLALDRYDGHTWSRVNTSRRPMIPKDGFFKLEEYKQPKSQLISQTFFLEALSTDVVFASYKALAVSNELGSLQRDRSGSLFSTLHARSKIRYTAVSEPVRVDPARVPSWYFPAPVDIRACCLQVPNEDPRVEGLAREVTAGTANPFEKALALESFLKTNYPYSLDLRGTPNHPDPVSMFLFEERRGHCEYFATAMVVMLRQLNIPARLVNGFRMGEYNGLSGAWIVRQYDAHSWVEAWFYPYGWVEFDPTAPAPPRPRPDLLRSLGQFADALSLWWSEEVINYDFAKQFRLVYSLRSSLSSAQQRVTETTRRWSANLLNRLRSAHTAAAASSIFAACTLMVSVALGAWLLYRRKKNRRPGLLQTARRALRRRDAAFMVPSFYREALSILEGSGWTRQRNETGLEFASRLRPHPVASPLNQMTRLHYRIAYGADSRPGDAEEARVLLQRLRRALSAKNQKGGSHIPAARGGMPQPGV